MATITTQPCPDCGGTMTFTSRSRLIRCGDLVDEVLVTAWWCDSCDEGILTGDDLIWYSRALGELKARAGATPSSG